MKHKAKAAGGPIFTGPMLVLIFLSLLGFAAMGWRFVAGLGPTTALNDGYPWGIWIAFDVVIGTALACGGYAIALLVYIFNRGRYHPLVRPALLTSLLGYGLAGLAIAVDVGRYWLLYKVLDPRLWNLNSVLLEVALCVMIYIVVLLLEISPAFLERGQQSKRPWVQRSSQKLLPFIERLLLFFIALGLLLPTMHQSSLGSVLLLASTKIHALWHTPLLPLLFLTSCLCVGYGAVIVESSLSSLSFRLPQETPILRKLALPISLLLLAFFVIRLADLAYRGRLSLIGTSGGLGLLFLLEMLLFFLPALLLLIPQVRQNAGGLFSIALLVLFAGSLYRISAYLIAYNPGPGWTYFPALTEILITVGILSFEVALYLFLVKRFPILARPTQETTPATEKAHLANA